MLQNLSFRPLSAAPVAVSSPVFPLQGRLDEDGYTISETQFWADSLRSWEIVAPSDALVICLNTAGYGCLPTSGENLEFTSGVGGFSLGKNGAGHRAQGETHRFITIIISAEFWMSRLLRHSAQLSAAFSNPGKSRGIAGLLPKSISIDKLARQLLRPPVAQAARSLWIESKLGELLCDIAFAPNEEKFCARYQRVTQERVQQTVEIIRTHLADPPSLAEIGRQVGCSPFHLSRVFSAETGRTIPQFLRHLRMERAAELLQSGDFNVTETAFEVGYSSLSHFSKSYFETFGVLPKNGARLVG